MTITDETGAVLINEDDSVLQKKILQILTTFGTTGNMNLAVLGFSQMLNAYLQTALRAGYIRKDDALKLAHETVDDSIESMIDLGMGMFALACLDTHVVGAYVMQTKVAPAARTIAKEFSQLFADYENEYDLAHDRMVERIEKAMAESMSHCRKSLRQAVSNAPDPCSCRSGEDGAESAAVEGDGQ